MLHHILVLLSTKFQLNRMSTVGVIWKGKSLDTDAKGHNIIRPFFQKWSYENLNNTLKIMVERNVKCVMFVHRASYISVHFV